MIRSYFRDVRPSQPISLAVASLVAGFICAPPLYADLSGYRLQPVVVTASVWSPAQPPFTHHTALPVDVARSKGIVTVESFVNTVSGIDAVNSGGQISVFSQGMGSYQTRVFFNGLDLKDASSTNGAANFDGLNPYTIDTIDVLRGSQTALYGANAIGGVLNFQSAPTGTQTHAVVGERYTNFGVKTATQLGDIVLSGGINRYEDSRLSSKSGTPDLDPISSVNKFGRLEWQDDTQRWTAQLLSIDTTAFIDGYGGNVPDERLRTRSTRWGSTYERQLSSEWSWGGSYQETQVTREGIDDANSSIYVGNTQKADTYLEWTNGLQQLRFGMDMYQDDGSSKTPYGTSVARTLTSFGTYTGYTGQFEQIRVGATTRIQSDPLTSAWRVVGGIDTVVSVNAALAVVGSVQTGVRHPSVYETSKTLNGGSLASDQSFSKSVGAAWTGWIGTQSVRWFESTVEQPIEYYDVFGQPNGYYNQQGNAIARGIELASEFKLPGFLPLSFNYTSTDAFGSTGKSPRIPVYKWVISGGLDAGYGTIGFTTRSVGGYRDTIYSNDEVAGYGLTDVTFRYTQAKWIQPFVTVNNVFDHQYQPIIGYNALGRSVIIGFETQFD